MLASVVVSMLLANAIGQVSVTSAAPPPPIDMADLFLVERDGEWFCPPSGPLQPSVPPSVAKKCPPKGSEAAVNALLLSLRTTERPNLYLRVAKARSQCPAGEECPDWTGVPDGCLEEVSGSTQCTALRALRQHKIKLGVVMGLEEDNSDKPRSVRELAWQACQIKKADTGRLYDFIFLDMTRNLNVRQIKKAVDRIKRGVTNDGTKCPGVLGRAGWKKVITNDNQTPTLKTGAWAHAKGLSLLTHGTEDEIKRAARRGSVLTKTDLKFLKQVKDLHDRSFAILRFEVPPQTSTLAGLRPRVQCLLLKQLARRQRSRYRLIYPLFVHSTGDLAHYDSFFEEETFGLQRALMDRYSGQATGKGAQVFRMNTFHCAT